MPPTTSGVRTCAEFHGNSIPPHVMAMSTETALPIMIRLPLFARVRAVILIELEEAHCQSIPPSVFFNSNLGVCTRRNTVLRRKVIPHRGMFRKNSHLHAPELANAPPMGGPIALRIPRSLRLQPQIKDRIPSYGPYTRSNTSAEEDFGDRCGGAYDATIPAIFPRSGRGTRSA